MDWVLSKATQPRLSNLIHMVENQLQKWLVSILRHGTMGCHIVTVCLPKKRVEAMKPVFWLSKNSRMVQFFSAQFVRHKWGIAQLLVCVMSASSLHSLFRSRTPHPLTPNPSFVLQGKVGDNTERSVYYLGVSLRSLRLATERNILSLITQHF